MVVEIKGRETEVMDKVIVVDLVAYKVFEVKIHIEKGIRVMLAEVKMEMTIVRLIR